MSAAQKFPPQSAPLEVSSTLLNATRTAASRLGLAIETQREHGPDGEYLRLWSEISEALGASAAYLVAQNMPVGALGRLDYVLINSRSIEVAMHHLAQYAELLAPGVVVNLREEDESLVLSFVDGRLHRVVCEWALAVCCDRFRRVVGRDFQVEAVRLQQPRPSDAPVADQYFACAVDYWQVESALEIRKALCRRISAHADSRLLSILHDDLEAEKLEASRRREQSFSARVRAAVEAGFEEGVFGKAEVSRRLSLSSSEIQRRLRGEGHASYARFVDRVREELAKRHLKGSRASVLSIALKLGYSDASNFVRAFRRWTGSTPGQFRAAYLAEKNDNNSPKR